METCAELGISVNDKCPDCGATLSYDSRDERILECNNGCGWQCQDDPDADDTEF